MHRLFPKINELTVFIITVLLYAAILISPELTEAVSSAANEVWLKILRNFSHSQGFLEKAKQTFIAIVGGLVLLCYLIGPLLLPFTKRDIRVVSIMILWIDSGIVIYWNSQSTGAYRALSSILILYWAAWMIYSVILLRVDPKAGVDTLLDKHQTSPQVALSFAVPGICLLILFFFALQWEWIEAYLMAVFITLMIERHLTQCFSDFLGHNGKD
jgi:hypothetical protein